MNQYNANTRGIPKQNDKFFKERSQQEHGRLSSTLIYFEISKEDIEIIYSIKEAYLQLKEIIACCK